MILIVDERNEVVEGYASLFDREGVSATGINSVDFNKWISTVSEVDLGAVDAILLGHVEGRASITRGVKSRLRTALIALNDQRSLDETLELFAAGVDDVIGKPVHVREILARVAAIRRRLPAGDEQPAANGLRVFYDGRDPEIGGHVLRLPRRERRILEYLVSKSERRVTKTQIFNAVYGLFNETIDENIIESHISKLRKRLRQRLGFDPIDSQRYLGYRLVLPDVAIEAQGEFAIDE
ncbi:MAG: winged helix-turn-helix domain-containing protein [Hyphomicrobium sp.]